MQFLRLDRNMRLVDLASVVGQDNLDTTLAINNMERQPDIYESYQTMRNSFISSAAPLVSFERKQTLLNQVVSDAELFEYVALQDEDSWKLFSSAGVLDGYIRIPDTVNAPNSTRIIGGNADPVQKNIYSESMGCLKRGINVLPEIFNQYAQVSAAKMLPGTVRSSSLYQNFKIPFGSVTLYSSLSDESIEFPVYPSELSDGVKANYDTMPDMLFQYEPWQVYKSSGPRQCTLSFDMHRDMWTGDHRDGQCAKLIRFCEAACYPRYNGASVQTTTSTLYIAGKSYVSGIITDVTPKWDTNSPLGLDGFYLHVILTITFVEVSKEPLSYDTIMRKGLIG